MHPRERVRTSLDRLFHSMAGLLSLHGGHSAPACTHASGSLDQLVEAAIARGMTCFGVTEHAPKTRVEDLDEHDLRLGVGPEASHRAFDVLARETFPDVQRRYASRIRLLWGMETDVVPADGFVARMHALAQRYSPRYLVGSVHHVNDILFDGSCANFDRAVTACGDVEALQLAYFAHQAHLIETLKPMVVGHFDLIRKHAALIPSAPVETAVRENLARIADFGLLLELNGSPPRETPGAEPFPSRTLLRQARAMGVRICLGDDSHAPEQVGGGLPECVAAAQDCGFDAIWGLEDDAAAELKPVLWQRL